MTSRYHCATGEPGAVGAGAREPAFTVREWLRMAAMYGFIVILHVLGWGLFLHYSAQYPALVGLGLAAYLFGLRHAFDADHIAAVDDTVRYLLKQGSKPLAVGFFFSLGHSTVVFALAIGIALAAATLKEALPGLQAAGGLIGTGVSGVFLWVIGILNLMVLVDLVAVWRSARGGAHGHHHVDELLQRRGLLNRLLGERFRRLMRRSASMYPLGILFGLGFDTASEIGLLALTAGAATGDLPMGAVLSLPLLFAAGMTAMDTTDGVLMCKAYDWALLDPVRRVFYNITTTALTVAMALVIGSVQLLQALRAALALDGPFFDAVGALELGMLGYVAVAILLAAWVASVALWRFRRVDDRPRGGAYTHAHPHTHANGVTHVHRHLH